jgi:heme/copper-type cytochrome/quinol oxidase subunit 2
MIVLAVILVVVVIEVLVVVVVIVVAAPRERHRPQPIEPERRGSSFRWAAKKPVMWEGTQARADFPYDL